MSTNAEPAVPQLRPPQSSLSSYTDYASSDSRCLPDLPGAWWTSRLKFLATINPSNVDKRSEEDEEPVRLCNYTDVYYENEITEDLDFMEATASREEIEQYSLQEQDVVVTKDSESWDDIAIPAFVPRTLNGVLCGYHLAIVRPIEGRASGRFLSYAFQAENIAAQLRVEASGITRYGLTVRALQDAEFPVPPLRDQSQIADYLDRKTSRIDRLIAKKQRLIELLEERRMALITKAVTKGLNPDVPMKDSGVEWLGGIPEEWDIAPLSAAVKGCYNGFWGDEPDGEHDVACLRVEDFERFRATVRTEEPTIRSVEPKYRPQRELQVGDLLLEKSGGGEKQPVGFAVLVGKLDRPSVCSNFAARLPVREGVSSSFLRFVLYHLYHTGVNTRSIKQTTGIQNLDADHYLSTPIAVPPESVQRKIAGYLEDQTAETERLMSHVHEAIDRLQEYRSALITAAVTGKIDIRDHAA